MKQFWTGIGLGVMGMGAGVILHSALTHSEPLPIHAPISATKADHLATIVQLNEPTMQIGYSTGTPSMSVA